jgi:hypothetical protein
MNSSGRRLASIRMLIIQLAEFTVHFPYLLLARGEEVVAS